MTIPEGFASWVGELEGSIRARLDKGIGRLSVIAGPSRSQKTSRLDSIAIDAQMAFQFAQTHLVEAARHPPRYYTYGTSEREVKDIQNARRSKKFGPLPPVSRVGDAHRVRVLAGHCVDFLLIDDVHLFDAQMVEVCEDFATTLAVDVTAAGKPLDEDGTPYPVMAGLMCLADDIELRTGICCSCASLASKTAVLQRATPDSSDKPDFQPICRACLVSQQRPLLPRHSGRIANLQMIVGPSYAGKTEEFIREIRHYLVAGLGSKIQVFYPKALEGRYSKRIWSYDQRGVPTNTAETLDQVLRKVRNDTSALFLDSLESFPDLGPETAKAINQLVDQGKNVTCTGVEVRTSGEPILSIGHLLCYADKITKLAATCWACGGLRRAARIIEVGPELGKSVFKVAEEGREYRSICRSCLRHKDRSGIYQASSGLNTG